MNAVDAGLAAVDAANKAVAGAASEAGQAVADAANGAGKAVNDAGQAVAVNFEKGLNDAGQAVAVNLERSLSALSGVPATPSTSDVIAEELEHAATHEEPSSFARALSRAHAEPLTFGLVMLALVAGWLVGLVDMLFGAGAFGGRTSRASASVSALGGSELDLISPGRRDAARKPQEKTTGKGT